MYNASTQDFWTKPVSTQRIKANVSKRYSREAIWQKIAGYYLPLTVWPDKWPNVEKSCLKMISLEKWMIVTPLQKLPKNVGDLGKSIVSKGFEKLP